MFYYAAEGLNFLYIVSMYLRVKKVKSVLKDCLYKSFIIKELQSSISKGA